MSNPVEKRAVDPYSNAYLNPVGRKSKKKPSTIAKIKGVITKAFKTDPNEVLDKPKEAKEPKYQKL
ncbi:MAG: hypothetical protein PVI40_02650 [Chlamydiota bacterium]